MGCMAWNSLCIIIINSSRLEARQIPWFDPYSCFQWIMAGYYLFMCSELNYLRTRWSMVRNGVLKLRPEQREFFWRRFCVYGTQRFRWTEWNDMWQWLDEISKGQAELDFDREEPSAYNSTAEHIIAD